MNDDWIDDAVREDGIDMIAEATGDAIRIRDDGFGKLTGFEEGDDE